MTCYHPVTVGRAGGGPSRVTGKWPLTFTLRQAAPNSLMQVPCGRCIGCVEDRARDWTIRMVHESQMHKKSCFITLTYSEEHLPTDGSLQKYDFQLFMKRLRKAIYEGYNKTTIRFFCSGEYGPGMCRPHYHAAIFGFDFPDKVLWKNRNLCRLYRSSLLEKEWGKGFATIGNLDYASAAYLAGYMVKKLGTRSRFRYDGKTPEFSIMSRRPGIGAAWIDKYQDEVYRDDTVMINGLQIRPPKYYDSKYKGIEELKLERMKKTKHKTKQQLHAIELNKHARKLIKQSKRSYEQGESVI